MFCVCGENGEKAYAIPLDTTSTNTTLKHSNMLMLIIRLLKRQNVPLLLEVIGTGKMCARCDDSVESMDCESSFRYNGAQVNNRYGVSCAT